MDGIFGRRCTHSWALIAIELESPCLEEDSFQLPSTILVRGSSSLDAVVEGLSKSPLLFCDVIIPKI
jgi:hypothetical protein